MESVSESVSLSVITSLHYLRSDMKHSDVCTACNVYKNNRPAASPHMNNLSLRYQHCRVGAYTHLYFRLPEDGASAPPHVGTTLCQA
jgi:hypothetical protein